QIFHAVKSPLGPMHVVSTTREVASGTPEAHCEVEVVTAIELPRAVWPFSRLLEALLRRLNDVVLQEDLTILERRQKLFGDWVDDYLHEGECMLFKDLFRQHYGRAVTRSCSSRGRRRSCRPRRAGSAASGVASPPPPRGTRGPR